MVVSMMRSAVGSDVGSNVGSLVGSYVGSCVGSLVGVGPVVRSEIGCGVRQVGGDRRCPIEEGHSTGPIIEGL